MVRLPLVVFALKGALPPLAESDRYLDAMARVEWAALSGDEVETVVAVLLYNKHPHAVRVRPARGDFGIDVLVPAVADPSTWDVYQIKKFATNLTANQKAQVEESFRRLLVGLVRRNVPVGDWYLVMPLDPTLDNLLDWFTAMPDAVIAAMFADKKLALTDDEKQRITAWRQAPGRIIHWEGLVFCEALTSDYWFVPDYYLHGGSERIRAAVADLAQILQRDNTLANTRVDTTAVLAPAEIREHLGRLQHALDGDPHFRYGLSLDPAPPDLHDEPWLISATQEIQADGSCITFRIYARFAEAVNERPVPIKVNFEFAEGSPDHEAFEAWRKYGKPLTVPASIDADLPGGLGGPLEQGKVSILPPDEQQPRRVRMRVKRPDGSTGDELVFTMVTTTGADRTGMWSSGSDTSGYLRTEGLLDLTTGTGTTSFSLEPLTGSNPVDVLPALRFAASLTHPNLLQMAGQYGPFFDLHDLPADMEIVPPVVLRLVTALAAIQEQTPTPITVPDMALLTGADFSEIVHAAALIEGRTVVGTWTATSLTLNSGVVIDPNATYQLAVTMPFGLTIGSQQLDLGAVQHLLLSVKLTRSHDGTVLASPALQNTAHRRFLPDVPAPTDPYPVLARLLADA